MKRLLPILILLLSSPCWATYALVQQTQSTGVTGASTIAKAFTSNVTINDIEIAIAGCNGTNLTATVTISSTRSASWTALFSRNDAANGQIKAWILVTPATGAETVTVSMTNSSDANLNIYEFSGNATTTPIDVTNNNSAAGTAITTGSITPTAANELVIAAAYDWNQAQTFTWPSPYAVNAVSVTTTGNETLTTSYNIQTTATATNPSISASVNTGTANMEAGIGALKVAGGAAAPSGFNKRQKIEQLEGIR